MINFPFDDAMKQFIVEFLQNMADFQPIRIAVVAVNNEDLLMTGYHNCNATDLRTMADGLREDAMWKVLRANADRLQRILDGEDDPDDDGYEGGEPNADTKG